MRAVERPAKSSNAHYGWHASFWQDGADIRVPNLRQVGSRMAKRPARPSANICVISHDLLPVEVLSKVQKVHFVHCHSQAHQSLIRP